MSGRFRSSIVTRTAASVLFVAMLGSACSSDSGDGESDASATTAAVPSGPTWRFHLTTFEGFEYDVVATIPTTVKLSKDVSSSPPGTARLLATVSGKQQWEIVSTLDGREQSVPPTPSSGGTVTASFNHAMWTMPADLGINIEPDPYGPCASKTDEPSGTDVPAFVWTCVVGEEVKPLPVSDPDFDNSDNFNEADVDRLIATFNNRTPDFYVVDIDHGGCTVILYTDGRVAPATSTINCVS